MKQKGVSIRIFILQILVCLFLNWAGDRIVSALNLPLWLDSVGTVLAAWIIGPWCGAVIGATSSMLMYILYRVPWYYALISILIALFVGFAGRKKRLDSLLGAVTTGTALAVLTAVASYPINLSLHNADTGNIWGNAVIGFLKEAGFPVWIGLFIGELYVEVLDKATILAVLYLTIQTVRKCRRKAAKNNRKDENDGKDGKSAAAKATALLLIAGLCLTGMTGKARAEAKDSPEENYNNYVQTIYSSTNGLPCGEANDIAMTRDGIMWIGTYAGLYRYNGREFRWMDSFDSVRNVNCLYVDEEGRLWIGTNDNGLSIMINEQVVNVIDQSLGLPSNAVKDIVRSSDGYYYIGTTGSMQILTLNCGLKKLNTLPEVNYADQMAADDRGNVAAVTSDGTLFLLQQGQIVSSRQLPERQTVFKSCAFDRDGYLLAATSGDEIFRFDISRGWFELLDATRYEGLKSIKNMYMMEQGGMFICADNGVGFVTADGAYEKINTNDFNNSIDNMLIDYQGNLWFTSSRLGLLRMAQSDFRDIYTTAGMEKRVANTVVRWNDTWYFGTDKGMDAADLKGQSRVRDAVTDRFEGIRIRCMTVDREGHLWVCTYGNGLVELEPDGTEYIYNRENGAFGNRARVAVQLRDGTILAAGDTGLSFIRDHKVQKTITDTEGKISSMVLTITELPDGTILVGTDGNGLALIENGEVTGMLTRNDGLSSEVILRTVPDAENGVFVVTSNGLCYMDNDRSIRSLDNFPYFNNYDIWMKGTDSLFVLSSAGIYTVDREELLSGRENISYELLDSRRGLNSSLTANAWTWFDETTGDLYLPCDTGVFVINTETFSSGARAYRMSVSSVRLDGTVHQAERSVTMKIPRGTSRVEIFPEVINYTIQDPNVGYMLEGFDREWTIVPQDSLNSISYTNLHAGDYVFHLAVFDSSQEHILDERTYTFTKEREMYDSGWFILYLLSVPLITAGSIIWLFVRRHEQKIEEELKTANQQVEMGKQTVIAIARTVDAKDQRTSDHSRRVAMYSKQIAEAYGLDKKQCRDIEWSAQMHDIGKIAIPDAILNKPARLTDDEYSRMKTHTTSGAEILKDFTLLDNVIDGAKYHHERYDGRGYPQGLSGEQIPLFARIIGVADAFDAMTANRVYRQKLDFSHVLNEMEKGRGTQFDPVFVDILLKLIREGKIDLDSLYSVPQEENNTEKPEEKSGKTEKQGKEEQSSASAGSADTKKTEEGKA